MFRAAGVSQTVELPTEKLFEQTKGNQKECHSWNVAKQRRLAPGSQNVDDTEEFLPLADPAFSTVYLHVIHFGADERTVIESPYAYSRVGRANIKRAIWRLVKRQSANVRGYSRFRGNAGHEGREAWRKVGRGRRDD